MVKSLKESSENHHSNFVVPKNLNEARGTILVLLTALISGAAIVVNKFFVVSIDPLLFTAMRALFIGIIFFFISLYFARSSGKKFNKVSWKYLVSIGIVGGSVAFWLFFTGLKMTMAGRAAFLHKTLPIYATVLAVVFLKEKVSGKQLGALLVMLVGLLLMQLTKISFDVRMGDLFVLGATILWAAESTISKRVMKSESNWVVSFSRMFFGSLILFGLIFLMGKFDLFLSLTFEQVVYILISGGLLFGYVLTWYWGLKYINLSKASTILLLAPVISLVLAFAWLGESVYFLQVVGSVLILVGAGVVVRTKSEKRG